MEGEKKIIFEKLTHPHTLNIENEKYKINLNVDRFIHDSN